MKEYTLGDHGSVFHGPGVDFVGLRDWQAGDRLSSIDWPQSTLTNFNPLVIREYEQPGTAPIVVVADKSPSTRCGMTGTPIAAGIAQGDGHDRAVGGVFSGSCSGIITFDKGFASMAALRSARRAGARHPLPRRVSGPGRHGGREDGPAAGDDDRRGIFAGRRFCRLISDFLFEDAAERIKEIAELNSRA